MLKSSKKIKKLIYNEKYHDNCHDYLKPIYLEKYAVPKYKPLLYNIRQKIPKLNICEDTPFELYGEIIVCDQHAVIFSHHKDVYPVLATYALNACVGLVMYVDKYKVATLAHIDGLPGYSKQSAILDGLNIDFDPVYENIKIILKYIRSLCNTNENINIEYYLVGGIFDLSEVMVHDIIECINKFDKSNFNFEFKGRNILGPENQSRNICIDTKTGKITYFDYTVNSDYYANHRKADGIPINIIKAPRKSEAFLDITYISKMLNTTNQ
ncbi:putative chemotaxis protein ched [Tupanvirus deep ocean]|uniref:Chemotaxis protein ched n=2 Tax=Tupanvirus TaxID=2094720 RepID=A0AC62A9X7_9VIRU|nr:putative chemotaxis protein ched [Tupanvirus deep ocean]QKU34597.1 putative chemotaxis protein ched [Tupanvirus deep ocean]